MDDKKAALPFGVEKLDDPELPKPAGKPESVAPVDLTAAGGGVHLATNTSNTIEEENKTKKSDNLVDPSALESTVVLPKKNGNELLDTDGKRTGDNDTI